VSPHAELTINGSVFDIRNLEDLEPVLSSIGGSQFYEVWLSTPEGGPSLCALINRESAWLMYLRHSEGDPGFSTRNPHYAGPPEAMIEFHLSNGQVDHYPAAWNITTEEALRAFKHFFNTLDRAPWLEWHHDSKGRV